MINRIPVLIFDTQSCVTAQQLALSEQRRAQQQLAVSDAHDKRPSQPSGHAHEPAV